MIYIYHNPKCKKSREGLSYVQLLTSEYQVKNYISEKLTELELKQILNKLHLQPSEIIRTQEDYFKKNIKGKNFNQDELIKIILENPKLIKRPIIVSDRKAIIGESLEEIETFIKTYA